MKFLWFLPNTFTFLNLFFGCVAVVLGLNGDLEALAVFVLLGLVCDFLDGFFARMLNVKSRLGVQLDSLSDIVSFGLTSSIVIFVLLKKSNYIIDNGESNLYLQLIPYSSFLITIASSYRLAKFNLSSTDSFFIGLPTPANALFIVFLPFLFKNNIIFPGSDLLNNTFFLLFVLLLSSYLLICNLKMFSFKNINFSIKDNVSFNLFIITALCLIIAYSFAAFPLIIAIYILVNLLGIKF